MGLMKRLLLAATNQPAEDQNTSRALAVRPSNGALSPYGEPQHYAQARQEIIVPCLCAKYRKVYGLSFEQVPCGLYRYRGSMKEMDAGTVQGAPVSVRLDQVERPRAAFDCAWCNTSGPHGFGILACSCGALHCFGKPGGVGWLCACGRSNAVAWKMPLRLLQGYLVAAQAQALQYCEPQTFAPPEFYDFPQAPPPASAPRRRKIIFTETITRKEG